MGIKYGRGWGGARISLSRGSVLSREYFPSSCNCNCLLVRQRYHCDGCCMLLKFIIHHRTVLSSMSLFWMTYTVVYVTLWRMTDQYWLLQLHLAAFACCMLWSTCLNLITVNNLQHVVCRKVYAYNCTVIVQWSIICWWCTDSYADARARLNRAMETSTLETDDDEATGSGKSRRKRKKTFSDVEDHNSDVEERFASTQVKHDKLQLQRCQSLLDFFLAVTVSPCWVNLPWHEWWSFGHTPYASPSPQTSILAWLARWCSQTL